MLNVTNNDTDTSIIYVFNIYSLGSFICALLLVIVAIFGIIGNILTLFVFIKPGAMNSINVLLTGQAIMDIVLLVTATPLFATMGIIAYKPSGFASRIMRILVPYAYPIAMFSQTAAIWIAVIITCERYLAVCKPFKALTLCTPENAKTSVLVVVFLSAAYNVCHFWEYQLMNDFNLTPVLKDNHIYIDFYYHWLYFLTSFFLPFVILVTLNAFIINEIFAAKQRRQMASRHQNRNQNFVNGSRCNLYIFSLQYFTIHS